MRATARVLAVGMTVGLACAPGLASDVPGYTVTPSDEGYRILARFETFNRHVLALNFPLTRADVAASVDEFGYSTQDIEELAADCTGCDQAALDEHMRLYYGTRGIAAREEDGVFRLSVDVPAVVAQNKQRLHKLSHAVSQLATDLSYGPDQTLEAILSMVQAAMRYARPPEEEDGRHIIGFYPPPRALELGLGDCDTKSAVLASVLTNFPNVRLIGIHIPKHYLIGIARVPRHGEAFIEYGGEPFVLLEPAGPARLAPGAIAETTKAALATMQGVRIDPLF